MKLEERDILTQTELFQRIGRICSAVTDVRDEKELFKISLKLTMELFGANRGSIFILNENGKDLILKIAQGIKSEEERYIVKRMGEGIVGQVAKLKQPIFVDDIGNDKRFSTYKARSSYDTPSFICTPLIVKDQLIGVINISDKDSGSRFNKDEMLLLDFLSSQIALNYRRIQLYNKFKTIVKETKDLKNKLGQSDEETADLKNQIVIQEKLATIGKLAGGIAHEFNNPLDGIMRYTNLCLEQVDDDEIVRSYLLEIRQGLTRMADIVKNLLACSRNEIPQNVEENFSHALDHALNALKADIKFKEIQVTKDLDEEIPLIPDFGIERILMNLIRNAVDAMEHGGKLYITARYCNSLLTFDICDTGKGISEGEINKIFEPFYSTKEIDKGCGLGLTIVGEIIKSYEGNISVDSDPNKGTTFSISIPLSREYNGKS